MMKRRCAAVLFCAALLAGCTSADVRRPEADPRAAMQPVDAFVRALTNADIEALVAVFDDGATVFMPLDALPQRLEGKEQIGKEFGRLFDQMRKSAAGPPYMKLEPKDVTTQLFGDSAIVTFHLGSRPPAGATAPAAFSRRTFVLHRKDGVWLIEHLHASNMQLRPEK